MVKRLFLLFFGVMLLMEGIFLPNRVFAAEIDCINTSLGCVPVTINEFAGWFLQIIFGIAGGIAFLLMIYGFILIATSSGDEKKVAGAKETITSAITGLLVSIFALFIFKLVSVNILRIPGINDNNTGSDNSNIDADVRSTTHTNTIIDEDGNTIEIEHGGGSGESF